MTQEDIWDWQCRMFVYSSYLYEREHRAAISDWNYDQLSIMLLRHHAKLPGWFTARVPLSQLQAGTGLGLTFSLNEIEAAREWHDRVRVANEAMGRNTPHEYGT